MALSSVHVRREKPKLSPLWSHKMHEFDSLRGHQTHWVAGWFEGSLALDTDWTCDLPGGPNEISIIQP